MPVTVTTLVENTLGEHLGLKNEHGLSFCIQKDGRTVLFDVGQSGAFLYNADRLQIDLSRLDHVVLSHGHYDHSGGFRALTEKTTRFTLLLGEGFFLGKYGKIKNSFEYLGNNFSEGFLAEKGIHYRTVKEPVEEIMPGVYVLSSFPRVHQDEVISPRFQIKKNGTFSQDLFHDEIAMAVDTSKGTVVLLGCSHPGMKNMIDAVKTRLNTPVYAVFGGTHLVEASPASLELSLEYLQNKDLGVIGMSHCTGGTASERLKSNDMYVRNRTGSSYFFD
jgi:7,8-dihydropterin-6-yl-methyl-4-(beta-D-ribofuranosyl)aminobenzene 5'-phosphate synthase